MAHMYPFVSRRLAFTLACASTLTLAPAATAAIRADVRVVTDTGKTLVERTVRTDTVRIETDPKADCFGEGTEGSGKRVRVPGPTALGIVVDAAAFDRDVRPISVTDAFDFGLGICGFGGHQAPSSGFWYLKHNHAAAFAGGDQVTLNRGDDVLWWLDPDFSDAPPGELFLRTRRWARPDEPTRARVFAYDDAGNRSPAEGARVRFGDELTDADGFTTVTFDEPAPRVRLRARRAGDIPSNGERVCVANRRARCIGRRAARR